MIFDLGFSGFFHWDDWALVLMSKQYIDESSSVMMNFLTNLDRCDVVFAQNLAILEQS